MWPGNYYVCAEAPGYRRTSREVNVKPDGGDLGDVVIHRGVRLEGRVLTVRGRPIAGAEVFIDNLQF